jgi:hypothetical protein
MTVENYLTEAVESITIIENNNFAIRKQIVLLMLIDDPKLAKWLRTILKVYS